MERRGAPEGTRSSFLHPTYLHCVGYAKKGGHYFTDGHTELCVGHSRQPVHVRVERSMMNRGGCGRRDDCGKDPRCHRGRGYRGSCDLGMARPSCADLKTADLLKRPSSVECSTALKRTSRLALDLQIGAIVKKCFFLQMGFEAE